MTNPSPTANPTTPRIPLGRELQNIPLDVLEKFFEGTTPPEAIRMYLTIAKGGHMFPGAGWFGPGQSRYSWNWLAEQCGVDPLSDGIARKQFPGPAAWFDRMDRNRDGTISRFDLDWSDDNPWMKHASLATRLFRQMNKTGTGRLSREEWIAFFDAAAKGNDTVSASELRGHWLAGLGGSYLPGDAPTKEMLLEGLFSGEVGSMQEGPSLNAAAPDFALKTPAGDRTVRLSDMIGKRPIVLVFGNFTCGPFRLIYAEVDEIARRYAEPAAFLGVYVREAHPTDGWRMDSNEKVGVSVAQPQTLSERIAVAQQCFTRLKPSLPWLVDDVDDATGHAYSGMPARLYIIDTNGKVAYKSGRGPFGFKPGEMEQSLLMLLMDQSRKG